MGDLLQIALGSFPYFLFLVLLFLVGGREGAINNNSKFNAILYAIYSCIKINFISLTKRFRKQNLHEIVHTKIIAH